MIHEVDSLYGSQFYNRSYVSPYTFIEDNLAYGENILAERDAMKDRIARLTHKYYFYLYLMRILNQQILNYASIMRNRGRFGVASSPSLFLRSSSYSVQEPG